MNAGSIDEPRSEFPVMEHPSACVLPASPSIGDAFEGCKCHASREDASRNSKQKENTPLICICVLPADGMCLQGPRSDFQSEGSALQALAHPIKWHDTITEEAFGQVVVAQRIVLETATSVAPAASVPLSDNISGCETGNFQGYRSVSR